MSHDKLTNNETVLIVNPNSGGGATGKNWERLYNHIKKILSENPEVVFSQTSEHAVVIVFATWGDR